MILREVEPENWVECCECRELRECGSYQHCTLHRIAFMLVNWNAYRRNMGMTEMVLAEKFPQDRLFDG